MRCVRFLLKSVTVCFGEKKELIIRTITSKVNLQIFSQILFIKLIAEFVMFYILSELVFRNVSLVYKNIV